MRYQNYLHFKLPITMNISENGKLIEQIGNKYIFQLATNNILVVKETDKVNYMRLFRKGELVLEYKDEISSDNTFIRYIYDQKFTFKDNKLVSTEILAANIWINIYNSAIKYEDKNSINITPFILNTQKRSFSTCSIEKDYLFPEWLENSKYAAELFILFEIFLILLMIIIFFVILPNNSNEITTLIASTNIIKLRRIKSQNVWNELILNFNNKIFTKSLFETKFNQFWNKIEDKFTENNHMFILFKIKYVNNEYATIGNLQRLNQNDKNWYINWIINNMEFKSEYYIETTIESLIFSYGFKQGKAPIKKSFTENIRYQEYQNNTIPISYNPFDYGKLTGKDQFDNYSQFILQNKEGNLINFKQFNKYNEITIFNKGEIILSFKDEYILDNKFVRIINNKKYYFENNQQILFMKENKVKFISKIPVSKNTNNNVLILDIETFIKDQILIPYVISIYDGKTANSFFYLDYKNVDDLVMSALKSIMIKKYNNYNIYIHNLAKFDIIFLLKYLIKLGSINPIIHNNKIISIDLNFGDNNKYQLHFKDSYLILLASLKKLSEYFSVNTPKSVFPIFFVNENNLNYKGNVPDIKYFGNKITQEEYDNYSKNFNSNWNLKIEAIKYCEIDCISLYQLIFKFNKLIFNLFKINIHKYPTLPSLAFAIFRSNFMMETVIPQLSGKIANDIRQGYTGGSVDMYIPKPLERAKIYVYDVNALYPFQMKSQPMPVGAPTYFKGNIWNLEENAFGFFYCKIIAPNNLNEPILQTHVKTNNGTRTIAPLGIWEDMLFSEEIKNAQKYGYKFEILWGYTFERKYIFVNYVSFLHNLRNQYPKSHPLNFIAKILLNSLYGRFGMDDNFPNINVIHKDYYNDFEIKFLELIIDKVEIGDYYLITIKSNIENESNANHNINIAIASSITAYSRIHMSQFKNNPDINLYYSDTDSIYTDSEIEDSFINNKVLGKLKLENICKRAVFLAAKLYCLEFENSELKIKVKGLKNTSDLKFNDFKNLCH
uniref:DNA polymerase n=1 Tax=Russula griseocarnosa TaxID=466936 RepID=A0A650AWH9_9AGAM|nr:hypothetical protein [Russula griseocarnosa]